MAKQELEKEEKNNGTRERPNKKEVIITVYVETPSPSDSSHQKTDDHVKKIKPKPSSQNPHQTAKTRIHDRRARLLAYSQELRTTGDSQKVQWPTSGSKPKPRVGNKRFTTPIRIRRTQSRWRYQRLVPEVDVYCNPKSFTGRNKKSAESETSSNFLRKLRCVLRPSPMVGLKAKYFSPENLAFSSETVFLLQPFIA